MTYGPAATIRRHRIYAIEYVAQAWPGERVEIWRQAIRELAQNPRRERRFELLDDGQLLPWEQGPGNSWTAKLPRQQDAKRNDTR